MAAPKIKPASADNNFVGTFARATLETLKVQCSFNAKAGKPFRKGQGQEIDINIAGVIGITSSAFSGSIAIGFPEATYLKIMSGMLGETFTELTPDLRDGASELINIIFGCAKKALNDGGHDISRAVPSVVQGEKLQVMHMAKSPPIVIPFESSDGKFQIEVVVE